MTLTSKIMLLQWDDQENSWIEFTFYHSLQESDNMNVRFVNFPWRRDKPWINRKLRCMNLRFD